MTKSFCDNCECEIKWKHIRFTISESYFALSNCLTSNPQPKDEFLFCSIECASKGFEKWLLKIEEDWKKDINK